MLHIHNGDAAADSARKSTIPGEHFAWRESLVTGPTPAGLSALEWRRVRAQHLSESYGVRETECAHSLARQEAALASFSDHEEVVLWFEHDLFCQLHLLYLLDWVSRHDLKATRLSLICIGEFPGKKDFRGLGELSPEELASLFPARTEVTDAQTMLASATWRAYGATEPSEIEKVIEQDTSPLPFLNRALRAHLARFPSTSNGLGRIENRALEFMAEGLNSFTDLFARFAKTEPSYGFGDAQFWLALRRLSAARNPLLTISGPDPNPPALTPEIVQAAKFEITELGQAVRQGEADFVMLNGIDLWLGGVHLHEPAGLWRYNEESQSIASSGNN